MVFILTVIVASLSWHFFESPLLRLKERLVPRADAPAIFGDVVASCEV